MTAVFSLALLLGSAVTTQYASPPSNGASDYLQRRLEQQQVSNWARAGTSPGSYRLRSDDIGTFRLMSKNQASANDVETVFRSVPASDFAQKRIRVSLEIRTIGTKDGAGLWVRVDDKAGKAIVLKDMENRLIVGSTPWAKYELIVDLPKDAAQIGYGVVLVGKGEVMFQNVRIEGLDTL